MSKGNYGDYDHPEERPRTGWLVGIAWLIAVVIFLIALGTLLGHIAS